MRKSPIAGSWYPGTSGEIKGLVNKFLDDTDLPDIKGRPVGMIAPHAGIQFSGMAAAYGYKAVKGLNIDRVIIMGPSHYFPFRGVAVSGEDMYETPVGKIEVDKKITDDLYDKPLFEGPRNAEIQEHSLEMQLPFLQVVLVIQMSSLMMLIYIFWLILKYSLLQLTKTLNKNSLRCCGIRH